MSMIDPTELDGLLSKAAKPALAQIRRDKLDAPPRIRWMLDYLESALFDPSLNVSTWKRALGLRDNSVASQFHAYTGRPPKRYINQLRHETAARLLCQTKLQVWQISELVGFSSLGVFSKSFVLVMGQRPSTYRKTHRKPEEATASTAAVFDLADIQAALAGKLDENRAAQLLAAILRHYPKLAVTFSPTGDP